MNKWQRFLGGPGRSIVRICILQWLITLFQVAWFKYSHCKSPYSTSRVGVIAQTKYIPLHTRYVRAKLQVEVKLLQIVRPT